MKAFEYVNATSEHEAVAALKVDGIALPMAGGTCLALPNDFHGMKASTV